MRAEAMAILEPLLNCDSKAVRQRIVVTLLGSQDPQLVRLGVEQLRLTPIPDADVFEAARAALDGPLETRALAAELVVDLAADATDEESAEAYAGMLRHADATVRGAVLRRLASHPPGRLALRDDLLYPLSEHLHDPVGELRVEAARTILALGYPHSTEIVSQLAYDPDPAVRHGLLEALHEAGAAAVIPRVTEIVRHVGTLLEWNGSDSDEAWSKWSAALDSVAADAAAPVAALLATVLVGLPADADAGAASQAVSDLRARILELTGGGRDFLRVCHRLMEPPNPSAEHAAGLAAVAAAEDALAMDFLWALCCQSSGGAGQAAQRALSELIAVPKSRAVRMELATALSRTDESSRRAMLRELIDGGVG